MAIPLWKPLIVCDGIENACNFEDFMLLIKNGIQDMVLLSTLVVVAVLAYAGFIWLTSGGNASAHTQAKAMLWKVVIGYLWILGAWLLVYTITSAILGPGYSLLGSPTAN